MKAPKTKVVLIALYCIILGVLYICLSVLSICSYACLIDFTKIPVAYMLYLLYFRKSSCHSDINWSALGMESQPSSQPSTPQETSAVLRTLIFSIVYLVLNLSLVIAAFRAMAGVREKGINRHTLFWSYFAAFFIIFIAIIALDFLSSAFYLVEFFLTFYNPHNVMRILEFSSTDEFTQYFDNLSVNTRSMPSMLLFLATSKVLLLLTLNCALIYTFFTAAWKICRENQKYIFKVQQTTEKKQKKRKEPSPIMSIKSLESDATKVVDTVKTDNNKTMTTTHTTQTETYTPSSNDDDNSSRDDSSEGTSELKLPRVPYEKATFEYTPRHNIYERSIRRY